MYEERKRMIQYQLIPRGIKDSNVLDAFLRVPRDAFVPKSYANFAYQDYPLQIGEDQTISQPYIVALMTEALDLQASDTVLEIGTGSGYQTAILSLLCAHVYTVERIESLQTNAKQILNELGYTNITHKLGDGSKGFSQHAPYDKIIVTAAAKKIPQALLDQLNDPGLLVIPVGGWLMQSLMLIKKAKGQVTKESLCGCRFVPLIEE